MIINSNIGEDFICGSLDCDSYGCDYCQKCSHAHFICKGTDEKGKERSWVFNPQFGPSFLRKDGEEMKRQPSIESAAWAVFERWHEKHKRGSHKKMEEIPYGEILTEIESVLIDHACRVEKKNAPPSYSYSDEVFRAILTIFMNASLYKLWEKTDGEDIKKRADSAEQFGNKLRELILEFTGVDSHNLF